MSQDLNRSQQLGLLVGIGAFFKTFAWNEQEQAKKNYVPMSKETQDQKGKESNFGKTRKAMNLACTYLAQSELGIGLNPKLVDFHMAAIKNWKKYFVQFLAEKENLQLKQECLDSIRLGVKLGREYKCKHKDHKLGHEGAVKLADTIFKITYDTEVRAFQESSVSPYFTREAGAVEFGEIMSDKIPRQLLEIPGGQFFDPREDDTVTGFSAADQIWGSDDEYVEPDNDFRSSNIIDFNARSELYGDLRREIMKLYHNPKGRDLVVRRAESLAKMEELADWQARSLRYWAFLCGQHDQRERVKQMQLERANEVSDASGDEQWISL